MNGGVNSCIDPIPMRVCFIELSMYNSAKLTLVTHTVSWSAVDRHTYLAWRLTMIMKVVPLG